jgi:spoIIIJ-associated protein
MDFVETEGDTIDAAIENALKLLGVGRDKITVDIIAEGRKGILGFGAQKAKVRASLRKSAVDFATTEVERPVVELTTPPVDASAVAEKATSALTDILRLMGFTASVEQKTTHNGDETILQIKADNSGLLIGRKGQTLEALQYLVTRIAGERQGGDGPHIVVDIENYRERQRKSLEDMALRLGEKAKRQRKTVTIDALSAADRRVIHAVLQDDPWVTTKSLGQGAYRRLLIISEGDRRTKEGSSAPSQEKPATKGQQRPAKLDPARATEDDED